MARPSIEPVTDALLPEFAQFLSLHLSATRSAPEWEAGLRRQWAGTLPNYGFVLRDERRIVGGIGAYYADRQIRGRTERFCNITSWCVLDAYRAQSMRLGMALLQQPGIHFTNFSPTPVVSSSLRFLKFKPLDEAVILAPNLPAFATGLELHCGAATIEASLDEAQLAIYRDHAKLPWLEHVIVGKPGNWCHIIYKRHRYRGLPAARVIYANDRESLSGAWRRFAAHLLARGIITAQADRRLLGVLPPLAVVRNGYTAKLYLSPTLQPEDIDYLYSESVALDL
jgi:hypothetical protein